jgi:hypothetical protein
VTGSRVTKVREESETNTIQEAIYFLSQRKYS